MYLRTIVANQEVSQITLFFASKTAVGEFFGQISSLDATITFDLMKNLEENNL